ncbi:hypothetical protein GCM10007386_43400 [Pseudoduganella dura]|nr:hypothetical protein GCM10007386_43400 [Pseudoduganella dura]
MQIVASIKTVGFRNNLDGQSLPVATFDGRSDPGGCTGFNTLPAIIIPYARLEPFSATDEGTLAIIFDVKSTTDKNSNLLSNAQMALGVAAVFTTGGAATTVAGLTAAFAKPALSKAEQKIDKSIGMIVPGQARVDLTWPSIRNGIKSITLPVYAARTKFREQPDVVISRLRNTKINANDKLFDIVLTFSYSKTLFDPRISSKDELPKGDSVAKIFVLNYPRLPGIQNFIQLLNANAPSLLQTLANAKTQPEKAAATSKAVEVLESTGLNEIDRAIVMKSFIDEAKKDVNWYGAPEVNQYFYDLTDLKAQVIRIYGSGGQYVGIADTQAGMGEKFDSWKQAVPPILADLRQALTTTEARTAALSNFNGGADIEVSFYPGPGEWVTAAPMTSGTSVPGTTGGTSTDDAAIKYPPGITKLAATGVTKAGCFAYGSDANLEAENFGGHMIVVSEKGEPWRADVKVGPKGGGKISKVTLARLTDDWKNYFKSATFGGGDCPGILSSL